MEYFKLVTYCFKTNRTIVKNNDNNYAWILCVCILLLHKTPGKCNMAYTLVRIVGIPFQIWHNVHSTSHICIRKSCPAINAHKWDSETQPQNYFVQEIKLKHNNNNIMYILSMFHWNIRDVLSLVCVVWGAVGHL